MPGARSRPGEAAAFDSCVARDSFESLANTVAVVLACSRFAKLADAVKAEKEEEFARLLVGLSGFPQDKFLDGIEVEQLMKRTSLTNGVVGLGLAVYDGKIVVARSFRGSPAREAGIGPGWQLLSVDGRVYLPTRSGTRQR